MSNPSPFSTFPKNKNQIHFLIFRNPISLVGGIENIAASHHNSLPYYTVLHYTLSQKTPRILIEFTTSTLVFTARVTWKWLSRWRSKTTRSSRCCRSPKLLLTGRGGWTSMIFRYPLTTRTKSLLVDSMTAVLGF